MQFYPQQHTYSHYSPYFTASAPFSGAGQLEPILYPSGGRDLHAAVPLFLVDVVGRTGAAAYRAPPATQRGLPPQACHRPLQVGPSGRWVIRGRLDATWREHRACLDALGQATWRAV